MFDNADPKHALANPRRAQRHMPHIWLEDGFWRVNPWNRRTLHVDLWNEAHSFANYLNAPLRDAHFRRVTEIYAGARNL